MTLELYIAICLTLIVIAIGVITTFLVLTLFQIKKAIHSLEQLAGRIDGEVAKIGQWMGTISNVAHIATGRVGRTATFAASALFALFRVLKRRRAKPEPASDEPD